MQRVAAHDAAHVTPGHAETAHGGEISRTLAILQKRPCTSPELHLSPNAISPSLRTSHLTPWPFPNSPTHTPGDSVHGGAASGATERLRRPPRTYAGPPNGSITISDPSGYAKRWCKVTWLAGEGYNGGDHPQWWCHYSGWVVVATGLID